MTGLDANSQGTSPVGGPSSNEGINTLNDVYTQACITFTLAESVTTNVAYDSSGYGNDTNGMFEWDEQYILTNYVWQGDLTIMFMKKSGMTYHEVYGDGNTNYVRGWALDAEEPKAAIVLTADSIISAQGRIAAHEIGHALGLSVADSLSLDPFHDLGPWPEGEESLMRSGTNGLGGVVDSPGRWLRYEDWRKANKQAGAL